MSLLLGWRRRVRESERVRDVRLPVHRDVGVGVDADLRPVLTQRRVARTGRLLAWPPAGHHHQPQGRVGRQVQLVRDYLH